MKIIADKLHIHEINRKVLIARTPKISQPTTLTVANTCDTNLVPCNCLLTLSTKTIEYNEIWSIQNFINKCISDSVNTKSTTRIILLLSTLIILPKWSENDFSWFKMDHNPNKYNSFLTVYKHMMCAMTTNILFCNLQWWFTKLHCTNELSELNLRIIKYSYKTIKNFFIEKRLLT